MSSKKDQSSPTIVGGQPLGKRDGVSALSRGIERIVLLAAKDTVFRKEFTHDRSAALQKAGIVLTQPETLILETPAPARSSPWHAVFLHGRRAEDGVSFVPPRLSRRSAACTRAPMNPRPSMAFGLTPRPWENAPILSAQSNPRKKTQCWSSWDSMNLTAPLRSVPR